MNESELRFAMAEEAVKDYQDARRVAERDKDEWEGAKKGLSRAAKKVEALLAHLSKDLKEEKVTPEQAKDIQHWLSRAVAVVDNLRLGAEVYKQQAIGRVSAFDVVIKNAQRAAERAQVQLDEGERKPLGAGRLAALHAQTLDVGGDEEKVNGRDS